MLKRSFPAAAITTIALAAVFAQAGVSAASAAISQLGNLTMKNAASGLCITAVWDGDEYISVQYQCSNFSVQVYARAYSNVLGAYRFKDLGTGLCMTTGGGIAENSAIYERPCGTEANREQWWRHVYSQWGLYQFKNMHTGKCMSILDPIPRFPLVQQTCDLSDWGQFWQLDPW